MGKTNISVGKNSGYEFNTIQEAVDSINFTPTEKNPVNIYVNEGIGYVFLPMRIGATPEITVINIKKG